MHEHKVLEYIELEACMRADHNIFFSHYISLNSTHLMCFMNLSEVCDYSLCRGMESGHRQGPNENQVVHIRAKPSVLKPIAHHNQWGCNWICQSCYASEVLPYFDLL